MKRYAAGLVAALVVVGLWAVAGPDGISNAQTGCASQGAVDPGETALAADCEVLLDVRDTLAGTATLNWAADTSIEDWDGISVGGTPQRVVEIDLGVSGLNGTIPSELGDLTSLTSLRLYGNELSGQIPTQLRNLANLEILSLGRNQLDGNIPKELGSLSNLTGLWLDQNQLDGNIPKELGSLSNLTELWLWGNQLDGNIPRELGNLSNLTELWLGINELTGSIPTELGNLSSLTRLSFTRNRLTGDIPTELGDLTDLTFISLSSNRLSGDVPTELGSLSNLTRLYLWGNDLTGEMPDSFTALTSLEWLSFHSNAGLCAPIDNTFQTWLQGIDNVEGSSCALVDSQDDKAALTQFYNATNGANWVDNSNWLSNRPVREWYGVTNDANGRVTGLFLWDNRLSGSIPSELGDLSSLKRLNLNGNELSGAIPPELGNLSELSYISLRSNQLTGAIPPELGNLSNLRALFLGNNQLTGCIPNALRDVESNDFDEVGLPFCAPQAPSVGMTATTTPMVRINSPILVWAVFSEPVNGFTVDDVTVTNGDVSNFIGSDGDSIFIFDVTPNAIGVVTVDIATDVAQDSDANGNTAAAQLTLGLPYDDDHDGVISRPEVITAIGDFLFRGLLTRDQVIQIIGLFLFG